jgi:hypothetical protein
MKAVFIDEDWRWDWQRWPLFDEESGNRIGRIRWVCEQCEPNWFKQSGIIEQYAKRQAHTEETLLFFDPETKLATGLVTYFGDIWKTYALFLQPGAVEWQIATTEADFQKLIKPLLVKADQTWGLRLFLRNTDLHQIDLTKPALVFERLISQVSKQQPIEEQFFVNHADLKPSGTYHPDWFDKRMMKFDADSEAPRPAGGLNSITAFDWRGEDEVAWRARLAEALNPPKPRKTCESCARPKKDVVYETDFASAPKGLIGIPGPGNEFSPNKLCVVCAGLKPKIYDGIPLPPKPSTSIVQGRSHADWHKRFEADDYLTQEQANELRIPMDGIVGQKQRLPQLVWGIFMQDLERDDRDSYIQALWEAGWTHRSIADASSISHERIRQIILQPRITENLLPVPDAPRKPQKVEPVYVEPNPEDLARLLELQPLAQQVRSNSPKYRAEAEEYTKLLAKVHLDDHVTIYRLAKRLGVTHGAIRFRLARYGYITITGQSKSYQKVRDENRAIHDE